MDPMRITPVFKTRDMTTDAWGDNPSDIQTFLAEAFISFTLIHMDRVVLDELIRLSMGAAATVGQVARAGTRMGNNVARFAAGYKFFGVQITSPVAAKPWQFFHCMLADNPIEFPLGTEKSMVPIRFRAILYTTDPYQGGVGAQNQLLWSHTVLDT